MISFDFLRISITAGSFLRIKLIYRLSMISNSVILFDIISPVGYLENAAV
jgi:hypothetical protein